MKSPSGSLCALIVLALLIVLAGTVQAKTESINVQAGADVVRTVNLASEDRVSLKFSALGASSNALHFWVTFANGTTTDYGEIGEREMFFTSEVSGQFTMHFDNSNSSSSRLVTLNYEVEHYYFGMPNVLFIVVAITVLLVGVLAGYIIMGKYS